MINGLISFVPHVSISYPRAHEAHIDAILDQVLQEASNQHGRLLPPVHCVAVTAGPGTFLHDHSSKGWEQREFVPPIPLGEWGGPSRIMRSDRPSFLLCPLLIQERAEGMEATEYEINP